MARVPVVTPLFRARLDALGARPGTDVLRAVGATIAALAEAERLPGVLDTTASLPPTGKAYVRRVGGRNLWIWYRFDASMVWLRTVTAMPPVPLG